MHTAGKVFSVLSLLLAIVFVMYTSTIVNYRIEQRQQIDSVKAAIPGVEQQAAALDIQRDTLRADIDRLTRKVTQTTVAGLNEQELLDGRIAVLTDLINDANSKLKTWSLSLADVQAENQAREQEINGLNSDIAQAEKLKQDLTNANADLTSRLEEIRKGIDATLVSIQENHQRLIQLSEEKRAATPADRIAGANR